MDDPVKQIEGVVRSLTQGSPNEQAAAVNRYFVPNAEFVQPFCRVPPFENVTIPFVGEVNSRQLILSIFRWYRIISPRIDLKVNTAQFDKAGNKLYVDISQRMALWFVPFYAANVNLVTVLHLVKTEAQSRNNSYNRQLANTERSNHGHGQLKPIQGGYELPSFAEVALAKKPLLSDKSNDSAVRFDLAATNGADGDDQGERRFMIAKQEDLYQMNEFIKFLVPFGIGNFLVTAWQLFATSLCLASTIVFFPFVWMLTHGGNSGNVMPPVKSVTDDGQVKWKGVGAEWAKRTFSPLNSIGTSAIQGIVVNVQEKGEKLGEKAEAFADDVQQRGKKLIQNAVATEEAFVKNAQQKAGGFIDNVTQKGGTFAENVQQRGQAMIEDAQQKGQAVAENVQRTGEDLLASAQQKEQKLVRKAQAKEEQFVKGTQATEEHAAENTRQWWNNKNS